MDKSNLFRILLLSSFLTIFFSGFANSINDSKTTTKSYVLNPSSLVVPTISSQSPSTLDVCIGEPISLFVTANGNGVLNYQWQKDGVDITNATATTANLNIPASVAADAGNYICIVTDADGDITSDPSTVTVNSLPTINIDNLSGDFFLCEGEQITLTASGASSYDWGNGFSTDNDIVEFPTITKSYSVTGKDSNGCEASTSVQVVVNSLPTATVTSNGSICSGEDAVFEFTGTPGAEVVYRLNNTTDYTITLSSSGSFDVTISNPSSNQTVSLVEVSNTNCDVILNISETVSVQPIPAEPAVTNPPSYCQGDSSFSIASLVTGTDLKWYLASSGGSAQSTPPTQNTTNPGTFYYYVSQTINGCESPRAEVEVVVNATPVISISGNNSICPGDSTILTAAGGVSYVWSPGGETTSSIPATQTSDTTYSVTGTDANGCSNSTQITVTVNAEPTASVNAGSSPICSGEDAVFTITGTPGADVTYKLNAGAETNITLSSSGSYSLPITNATLNQEISLLKVTNTNTNCDVTLNITETVIVEPITPMPAVTNPPSYCQGDSSFSIASSATGTDLKWYLASSSGSPLSSPPTLVTLNPGTFYYYVSQTINGCESPRAEVEVVVNATPVISISGNNSICPGDSTILTAAGGVSYVWSPGGETTSSIPATQTSDTTYSVTGTDANGCSNSTQITVTVNAEPTASVNAGSSPICSGEDAVFTITGTPGADVTYKLNAGAETNITLSSSGSYSLPITNATLNQEISLLKVTNTNTNCDVTLNITETIFVNSIPDMPTVTNPPPYCQGDPPVALTAIGTDLKWYLAPSSGSSQSTPPIPVTSNPGTFSYYVSQTINGCESPRAEVQVQINVIPVISISGNNSICPSEGIILTADGGVSYVWSPGGETTSSIPVSPTSDTTYSVIGTDADGCSNSAQITVTVNAEPTANLSASSPICSGEDAVFTITGSANATVVYSIDSGANQTVVLDNSGSANITKPAALGNSEMSLISVNNANCTISLTDSETIFVNSSPVAPVVTSPISYCLDDTAAPLAPNTNTGNTLVWFNSDGTQLPSAPTVDTSSSGTFIFEVSQINSSGCESPRSQIIANVISSPVAPTVANSVVNFCLNEAASPLDTSGISNPKWYDEITGGNLIGTSLTPLTSSLGTTKFYVSDSLNDCEGPRTQVEVNVFSVPTAPTVTSSSVFYCKNETSDPLSSFISTSTSGTLNWYLVAISGIGSQTAPVIDTSAVGTNTYFVSETNILGCESLRTAITVTIADIPSTPTLGTVTNSSCFVPTGSVELSDLPAGNWTITNITDGTAYSSNTSSYTVSGLNPGTYSFSVSNNQSCESLVTNSITIDPVPVLSAPVVGTLVQH